MVSAFGTILLVHGLVISVAIAAPVILEQNAAQVVGHRGASGEAPENTMPSFKLAIAESAAAIETDLQLTRDGHIVLIHDSTVDRTTNGTGKVADFTLAELQTLDAGSWKGPQYANTRVPTLDECLALLRQHPSTRIVLDLKLTTSALNTALEHTLSRLDLGKRVMLGAWDFNQAKELHVQIPSAAPMFITSLLPTSLDDWRAIGLQIFSVDFHAVALDPGFVQDARDRGFQVYVWTVDEPNDIEMVTNWGVDGVITDYPLRALKQRNSIHHAFPTTDRAVEWALRACKESLSSHDHRWMTLLPGCQRAVAMECDLATSPLASSECMQAAHDIVEAAPTAYPRQHRQ